MDSIAEHKVKIDRIKNTKPAHVSFDQSASVRCPEHGRHCSAYFVRGNGIQPQYVCTHCWGSLPVTEWRPKYTEEEAARLDAEIDASRKAAEAAYGLAGDCPW